LNKTTGQAEQH